MLANRRWGLLLATLTRSKPSFCRTAGASERTSCQLHSFAMPQFGTHARNCQPHDIFSTCGLFFIKNPHFFGTNCSPRRQKFVMSEWATVDLFHEVMEIKQKQTSTIIPYEHFGSWRRNSDRPIKFWLGIKLFCVVPNRHMKAFHLLPLKSGPSFWKFLHNKTWLRAPVLWDT